MERGWGLRENAAMPRRDPFLLMTAACALMASVCVAQDAGEPAPSDEVEKAPATLPEVKEEKKDPEPGAECVVVMRDGQRITGEFVSRADGVVRVRVGGVELRISTAEIERVIAQLPLQERYRQMRALIDDGDAERLLLVAEWLRSNGLLDEAKREIEHVLRLTPTSPEALRLRDLIERQTLLRDRQREMEPSIPPGERSAPAERTPTRRAVNKPVPTLTPEQINLLKVFEIDLTDPPRIVIQRETVEKLLSQHSGNPLIPASREGKAEFFKLPPEEILSIMFRLQARDLYGEVQVLANPASMVQFRDHVNRGWLAQSCASTACHGGDDAGRLRLIGRRSASDESVYTNFLIMERFRLSSGEALINYETPEESPLLHMALPRQDARFPHPDVRGWSPAFRNTSARRYLQTVDWMKSMYLPRPEHPVEYPPKEAGSPDAEAEPAPVRGVPR